MINLENFELKIYKYKQSFEILNKAAQINSSSRKEMYVIAGPNGSGKSTLLANLYQSCALTVPYVSADSLARCDFDDIEDIEKYYEKAVFKTMGLLNDYIKSGKSFAYETTLSHPSKFNLINEAKEQGYKIISIFVYTTCPDINTVRIYRRERQGGPFIPSERLSSQYYNSMELGKKLKQVSDKFYIFDNTFTQNQSKSFQIL